MQKPSMFNLTNNYNARNIRSKSVVPETTNVEKIHVLCMSGNSKYQTPIKSAWEKIYMNTLILAGEKNLGARLKHGKIYSTIPTKQESSSNDGSVVMNYVISGDDITDKVSTYANYRIKNKITIKYDYIILWGHSYTPDVEEVFGVKDSKHEEAFVPGPYSAAGIHNLISPYIKSEKEDQQQNGKLFIYTCFGGGKLDPETISEFMNKYDDVSKKYLVYATKGSINTNQLIETLPDNLDKWCCM